ncbi:hypothetical protein [Saccharothrix sp. ST-888]|uniref:hypothetical protein n=1 Tax=Saccharothrix sp. ST-888 TaxID=1427391 RepID=UPI0005EC5CFD|nr:hypothetical protein [Saccharothrix sp. ST-888]
MMHLMRAEYGPGGRPDGVKTWHIVAEGEATAMCGRELDPGAESKDSTHWSDNPSLSCHTCGALHLRESPYLPAEHEVREQPE